MNVNFDKRDQLEGQIAGLLALADRRAIDLIYENYAETLLGLIKRMVESHEVAEEVLQDTFVKIWKNARKYEASKGRLFTWFANIARNTAIDRLRSAGFRQQQKTTSTENLVDINVMGSENAQIEDTGLSAVLASLDPKYRELIELTYFQGYSQRDIEKELGIPLGTIKTRLRTAINELRSKLNNDHVMKLLTVFFLLTQLLNAWF
ncbi:MAG: RNA polymerase subunit sigma-70 [Bacteroidetes bacterium]|nr:MAG: RNA polymerase subunit sigma-70 [Bacteroidota bacterium]PTM09555.1 MAG: RNA polymerase subunit sigma-70 [Bacteroidota bacterium]